MSSGFQYPEPLVPSELSMASRDCRGRLGLSATAHFAGANVGSGSRDLEGRVFGVRAMCDVDPASVNPVPGVGVITSSAADPSFVETCVHTLT